MKNLREFRQATNHEELFLTDEQKRTRQLGEIDKILRLKNLFFIECDKDTKKRIGDLLEAKIVENNKLIGDLKKEEEWKTIMDYIGHDSYSDLKILQDSMMEANRIFTKIQKEQTTSGSRKK